MNNPCLIPATEMLDVKKIEEYNEVFIKLYPEDWKPFVTKDNFEEYLKRMEEVKNGINNDGAKEIYYWLIDNDKIVGSGSIRLNPEINKDLELYAGHIFYQIVPNYRKLGYGKLICHLLLEEMQKLGFKEALVSCYDTNVGSINIIESNGGRLIETLNGDGSPNSDNVKTRRYKIDIDKSLIEYNAKHMK
jgi:predicted acetyltransferase